MILSKKELADYHLLLERQLADTENALKTRDTGTVMLDQSSVGRLSRMDALQQQAMAIELNERAHRNKRRLQAALDRIQTSTFGLCCRCEEIITRERLLADPAAPFCEGCQDEIENENRRE